MGQPHLHIDEFDFELPHGLIAQRPTARRDGSRLMMLGRQDGSIRHGGFADIVDCLRPEDVLVLNETQVVPARLRGCKQRTGGRIELLLLRRDETDNTWLALGRPLRGLSPGDLIRLDHSVLVIEVVERAGDRVRLRLPANTTVCGDDPTGFAALLPVVEGVGEIPLPPYIDRAPEAEDGERYQTVFAREPGSIAAPTAGLHFTDDLLRRIESRGVGVERLTLHVGPGTFEPVRVQDPRQHELEAEYDQLSEVAATNIRDRRRAGGRCIAVGTTSVRTLETCARQGQLRAGSGWTDLLICPPYAFQAVDGMVTNFHLPKSSLLLLVSALAGQQHLLAAYQTAIAEQYRFYSYGDAMLIS